jgi:hypothetical protein
VDVNFGQLLVVVPENVPVQSHAEAQGGDINNFGRTAEGWAIDSDVSEEGEDDIGLLTIDAEVGFGEIEVRRERADDDFTAGSTNGRRSRFRIGSIRRGGNE